MTEGDAAGVVLSAVYTAVALADLIVVADILANGALHRWASRQVRTWYRALAEPVTREAEVRRASAWVVWEAMQMCEEAAARS